MVEELLKKGADPCFVPNESKAGWFTAYQRMLGAKDKSQMISLLLKYKPYSSCYEEKDLHAEAIK